MKRYGKAWWQGLCFGMILQIAIGPMCLFVFQTASSNGFLTGEAAVIGTAAVDASEIIIAVLGGSILLEHHPRCRTAMQWFGALVLTAYGAASLATLFWGREVEAASLAGGTAQIPVMGKAILLALSDPLTVVFWAGVFSSKIADQPYDKHLIWLFGMGCVSATLLFLTGVSGISAAAGAVVSTELIRITNGAVSFFIMGFGIRQAFALIPEKTPLSAVSDTEV